MTNDEHAPTSGGQNSHRGSIKSFRAIWLVSSRLSKSILFIPFVANYHLKDGYVFLDGKRQRVQHRRMPLLSRLKHLLLLTILHI